MPSARGGGEPLSDLRLGLTSIPKRVPAKYFYDSQGSEIFSRIMEAPEYYLARVENHILRVHSAEILSAIERRESSIQGLNIVELGAGDGRKTVHLLRAANALSTYVVYSPIDISPAALHALENGLRSEFSDLRIAPRVLDLEIEMGRASLGLSNSMTNLVLYLGSSIGNFTLEEQVRFLGALRAVLTPKDFLLIGFDLKKDPNVLISAYDDSQGWTRRFNFNLLIRLNREFGGDFPLDGFHHHASYNPRTGAMESWLIARRDLVVNIRALELCLAFEAYEGMHVETSWKFSLKEIDRLREQAGFCLVTRRMDERAQFCVDLWS